MTKSISKFITEYNIKKLVMSINTLICYLGWREWTLSSTPSQVVWL